MIRTILVPLDGSAFGEQALALAIAVARKASARLELLHVHTPIREYSELMLFDVPLDKKVRAQGKAYLEGTREKLNKLGLPVSAAQKDGPVPEVIKEHAASIAADLV